MADVLVQVALATMLSARRVAEQCGFDEICLGSLKDPVRAVLAKGQHGDDRRRRVEAAEREAAITRLISGRVMRERFRDLTGTELADDYDFETEKEPRLKPDQKA